MRPSTAGGLVQPTGSRAGHSGLPLARGRPGRGLIVGPVQVLQWCVVVGDEEEGVPYLHPGLEVSHLPLWSAPWVPPLGR